MKFRGTWARYGLSHDLNGWSHDLNGWSHDLSAQSHDFSGQSHDLVAGHMTSISKLPYMHLPALMSASQGGHSVVQFYFSGWFAADGSGYRTRTCTVREQECVCVCMCVWVMCVSVYVCVYVWVCMRENWNFIGSTCSGHHLSYLPTECYQGRLSNKAWTSQKSK